MFRNIVLAYDGSEGAELALHQVDAFATAGAAVLVLAVGRIPEYSETVSEVDEAKEQASRHYAGLVASASDTLRSRGFEATAQVAFGKPADVIIRHAEEVGADLIVLGTNPHSALKRRMLGATVDKVVDHAHCSVLVVRPTPVGRL